MGNSTRPHRLNPLDSRALRRGTPLFLDLRVDARAIMTPATGPLVRSLPFLSRVYLSHAFRRLRRWDYEVSVARIDEN